MVIFFLGLHLLLELLVLVGVNSLFDLCLLLEFFVLEDVSFVFDLCPVSRVFFVLGDLVLRVWHCNLLLEFFCTWGCQLCVYLCR